MEQNVELLAVQNSDELTSGRVNTWMGDHL